MLCAALYNDWATDTDVMDERDFARFEFKMGLGRIHYIAWPPDPRSTIEHNDLSFSYVSSKT